jgi:hypothetical protein
MSSRGSEKQKPIVELVFGGGLVATLCLVLIIDAMTPDSLPQPDEVVLPRAAPAAPLPTILITDPDFDDVGKVLQRVMPELKYQQVALDELLDPARLSAVDILFFNCGGYPDNWLDKPLGDASRDRQTFTPNEAVYGKAQDNVRAFVQRGGTIYASDWRFGFVAEAFGDTVTQTSFAPGKSQRVAAQIVDKGLSGTIGPNINLNFDQDGWYPAALTGKTVKTYIEGSYEDTTGARRTAPLLITFPYGKGNVIFTAFHQESANSKVEHELLKFLVFATLTAETSAVVHEEMLRSGFSPASGSILSASRESPSLTRTYDCPKTGAIRFTVGFEDVGAKLTLTLTGPNGESLSESGTSTFSIDVDSAAAGTWTYTVEADHTPSEHFPFTVVVGAK